MFLESVLLYALGLGRDQTDCYSALVGLPPSTADAVAVSTGLGLVEVANALADLESHGLVSRRPGSDLYVASPPSIALGAMVAERQRSLTAAQRQIDALTDVYRSASTQLGATEVLDIIHGEAALLATIARLAANTRASVQALSTMPIAQLWTQSRPDSLKVSNERVVTQTVLERAVWNHPTLPDELGRALDSTFEMRFAPRLVSRLHLFDGEIGIIPLGPETDALGSSLVVRSRGMLALLQALFDRTWQSAAPLVRNSDHTLSIRETELEGTDLALLRLLNLGLTDAVVSKQMGLSLRTVQRRVALLMEYADVHSRLQLGVVAVRRGWLS